MSKFYEITNDEDVLDSRDIIERLDYLEDSMHDFQEENDLPDLDLSEEYMNKEYEFYFEGMTDEEIEEWDELEEYKALKALQDDLERYCPDWKYGVVLIRESYFEEYCKELCVELGYLSSDFPSWIEIDWSKTADNIRMDYTEADFDGVTYLAR